jgi:hypothetical protein
MYGRWATYGSVKQNVQMIIEKMDRKGKKALKRGLLKVAKVNRPVEWRNGLFTLNCR